MNDEAPLPMRLLARLMATAMEWRQVRAECLSGDEPTAEQVAKLEHMDAELERVVVELEKLRDAGQ